MKNRSHSLASLIVLGGLAAAGLRPAQANTVTLDFETAATGLNINTTPLVTPYGTITASASGGSSLLIFSDSPNTGLNGNFIDHIGLSATSDEFGQLAFGFQVSSITFNWAGRIGGVFTAQALDANLNVVASFFDGNTGDNLPGGPTTLSGADIRFLRWGDYPGGLTQAVLDNVQITVPDGGSTLALLGLGLPGLVGLAGFNRHRAASRRFDGN